MWRCITCMYFRTNHYCVFLSHEYCTTYFQPMWETCKLLSPSSPPSSHLVGLLASNGELTADAARKGAHFIRMCSMRYVPLLFLQNTPSDHQFLSETGNDGVTAKTRGQMMSALACSLVPKITVVMGGSYGPSSYAMVGLTTSVSSADQINAPT